MGNLITKMPLTYEPLKQNRWIMRFPADLGIQEWTLISASRPKMTVESKAIAFMNMETSVAGKYKWDLITVKFRDPIGPSTSQAVMEWMRLCSESVTGRQGYAAGYKRDVELEILDPTGVVVQKWILKNAWITEADFGSLDYSQDDLAEVSINLQFDYAILCY